MENCIFCKISKGEIPEERIYETKNFFSILDIRPAVKGHTIVISKKHFDNFLELPSEFAPEMSECIKETCKILEKKFGAHGFNISTNINEAGEQAIKHFHVHIFPRKNGDGVTLTFCKK